MAILTSKTELTTAALDDWVHIVDRSDTTSNPAGTSKKILVSNLLVADDFWVRDTSGSPFIKPKNAGDDLNMLQGEIYTIDPTNTSGTKSYQIVQTLTGAGAGVEHARFELKGLHGGSEKTFIDYTGADDFLGFKAKEYIFNYDPLTSVVIVKDFSNAIAPDSSISTRQFTGLDDNGIPNQVIYAQVETILSDNSMGNEFAKHIISVMEGGSLTEYMNLNGLLGVISVAKVISGITPTESDHLTTKEYADTSLANFGIDFFFNDTVSDIGGIYHDMTDAVLGGVESTITTSGLAVGNDQALGNFATLSGSPGVTTFNKGLYEVHFHAERTAGTKTVTIYYEVHRYEVDTTETLIATSEISGLVTSKSDFTLHANVLSDVDVADTDRLIIKFFANVAGGGSNVDVSLYQEGDTSSRVEFPTTTEILSDIFLRQDGTKELTGAWNAGAFTITVQEDIISDISGTDGYINSLDASDVERVRFDTNGDSWLIGGNMGFGTNAPTVMGHFVGDMIQDVHTDNVSNPPTDAELDAIFGTAVVVGSGFNAYIDDAAGGANFYHVASDGTNWFYSEYTKAV